MPDDDRHEYDRGRGAAPEGLAHERRRSGIARPVTSSAMSITTSGTISPTPDLRHPGVLAREVDQPRPGSCRSRSRRSPSGSGTGTGRRARRPAPARRTACSVIGVSGDERRDQDAGERRRRRALMHPVAAARCGRARRRSRTRRSADSAAARVSRPNRGPAVDRGDDQREHDDRDGEVEAVGRASLGPATSSAPTGRCLDAHRRGADAGPPQRPGARRGRRARPRPWPAAARCATAGTPARTAARRARPRSPT